MGKKKGFIIAGIVLAIIIIGAVVLFLLPINSYITHVPVLSQKENVMVAGGETIYVNDLVEISQVKGTPEVKIVSATWSDDSGSEDIVISESGNYIQFGNKEGNCDVLVEATVYWGNGKYHETVSTVVSVNVLEAKE